MARFAQLASFRTHQRSLRRTEPEDPRLAAATEKVERSRTSERSPEADRLKRDLDERTERVKDAAKEGSPDEVLARTTDRRAIEEARSKASELEPDDRVEVELAITRTADVDLRASASMLGRTDEPEARSMFDEVSRNAADDLRASTSAIRETVPSTSLEPEAATTAVTTTEVVDASTTSLTAQIDGFAQLDQPARVVDLDGALAGRRATVDPAGDGDDEAGVVPEPASVDFDPDLFDLSSAGAGETDHRAVLEDALADADERAGELEQELSLARIEESTSFTEVLTTGASIDAQMTVLELQSVETGAHGTGGADIDFVLNDHAITSVLTGISDEALATADYHVAVQRAELAELRAEVARDVSDGMSDAFDESALAGGAGVDTPTLPTLRPYAEQVDAFAARADVAAAEYEGLASMRDAFVAYGDGLRYDVMILESQLAAAESVYVANSSMSLERVAPPSGGLDLVDHRLDQSAFEASVRSLRDMSSVRAELAAKRAVLTDVDAEVAMLDARVEDAAEDLARAETRLEDAEALLEEAAEAAASGDDLPDLDPDAVARADLEELRDDIADLEAQLEDAQERADDADLEADIAEVHAQTSHAVADGLADLDFSLGHTEVEVLFVPGTPPSVIPVQQTDSGVDDARLRSAFDAVERDLEQRAAAVQQRAEADLAERREDELEALLADLQADEAELAESVPPIAEPETSDEGEGGDGLLVTDIDPGADLDLVAPSSSPAARPEPPIPDPPDDVPQPVTSGQFVSADALDDSTPADALTFGVGAAEPAPAAQVNGDEPADEPADEPVVAQIGQLPVEVATADQPAPADQPAAEETSMESLPVDELPDDPVELAATPVETVPVETVPVEAVPIEAAVIESPIVDDVADVDPLDLD